MKAIGFAKKYFTLWSITEETVYNSAGQQVGTKCHYCYIQNLSMDRQKAFEKAEKFGVKELCVDETLNGKSRSWSTYKSIEKKSDPFQFNFGKFKDTPFIQCTDVNYLVWYYNETGNENVIPRILELSDDHTFENGILKDYYRKVIDKIYSGIKVKCVSNFKVYDSSIELKVSIDDDKFNQRYPYGYTVSLDLDKNEHLNLNERYYSGYTYYVPKGMRSMKNKEVKILNNKIVIV